MTPSLQLPVLAIAADAHSCHPMTEPLLDTWWLNLTPNHKAQLFERDLNQDGGHFATL